MSARTVWRSLVATACLLLFSAQTGAEAVAPAERIQTPEAESGYSARAAVITRGADPDAASLVYQVQAQPNRTAATTAALNTCLAANPIQNAERGYCELTHSQGHRVATSTDLLAREETGPYALFLWRITSPSATVYLGGSIHILKAGLYPLAPQYQAAFDAADYYVTEVDLDALSPQELQFKYTQYGMLPGEQQLADIMSSELYSRLDAVTGEYGVPLANLSRFKPAFATQQLAVLALMSVGYDPNEGMESYFQEQIGNKQVLQLETIDLQLALLLDQPLDTQVTMIEETLSQMNEFETMTSDLIRAWLYGDDAAFRETFELQSGESQAARDFMKQLLDDRNVGMVEKIRSYLDSEGTYFVLAGAAHFIGDNGIIELLERQGITAQRIHSDDKI